MIWTDENGLEVDKASLLVLYCIACRMVLYLYRLGPSVVE